jgi:hypothetical protein
MSYRRVTTACPTCLQKTICWGKKLGGKVAVLQDNRHALSVLIQTEMGVGVATSCHMPQRAEESEYEACYCLLVWAHQGPSELNVRQPGSKSSA